MTTPYIGFGCDTLSKLPRVKIGDQITCPTCGGKHALRGDDNGGDLLLFYKCGDKNYLGAVGGALTVGVKSAVHGEVDLG